MHSPTANDASGQTFRKSSIACSAASRYLSSSKETPSTDANAWYWFCILSVWYKRRNSINGIFSLSLKSSAAKRDSWCSTRLKFASDMVLYSSKSLHLDISWIVLIPALWSRSYSSQSSTSGEKNPRRLTTFPFFFVGSRREYKDCRTCTIGGFRPSLVNAYI